MITSSFQQYLEGQERDGQNTFFFSKKIFIWLAAVHLRGWASFKRHHADVMQAGVKWDIMEPRNLHKNETSHSPYTSSILLVDKSHFHKLFFFFLSGRNMLKSKLNTFKIHWVFEIQTYIHFHTLQMLQSCNRPGCWMLSVFTFSFCTWAQISVFYAYTLLPLEFSCKWHIPSSWLCNCINQAYTDSSAGNNQIPFCSFFTLVGHRLTETPVWCSHEKSKRNLKMCSCWILGNINITAPNTSCLHLEYCMLF